MGSLKSEAQRKNEVALRRWPPPRVVVACSVGVRPRVAGSLKSHIVESPDSSSSFESGLAEVRFRFIVPLAAPHSALAATATDRRGFCEPSDQPGRKVRGHERGPAAEQQQLQE